MQTGALNQMTEIMSVAEQDPAAAIGQGIVSLTVLTDLHGSLMGVYSETLAELTAVDGAG